MTVSRESLLASLERSTEGFSAVLRDGDLAARVPSCPGYDLADLASHLGGIHRWGTQALQSTEPPPRPSTGPRERAPLVAWYADAAAELLTALRATEPDTACFTFGPPRTAAFWLRRQAHETAVHLWDAQSAAGAPDPLDPQLADDGVAEVLTVFLPRQISLDRIPPVECPVALVATDTGGQWLLGDGVPTARVGGPAEALLLLLWKRTSLDDPRLCVDGDPTATLSAALTP